MDTSDNWGALICREPLTNYCNNIRQKCKTENKNNRHHDQKGENGTKEEAVCCRLTSCLLSQHEITDIDRLNGAGENPRGKSDNNDRHKIGVHRTTNAKCGGDYNFPYQGPNLNHYS